MLAIWAAVALSCMGWRDSTALARPPEQPAGYGYQSALFTCTITVWSGGMRCTEGEPGTPGGSSRALLGGGQVKMSFASLRYDSIAYITSFDAAVQNLMSAPIGTPDGVTRTGLKVYFEQQPKSTAYMAGYDTGTVYVNNPDGRQNFTAADQPYFRYDTILPTNAVSAVKRWEYRIPRSVASVAFSVRVFTYVPSEPLVPDPAPTGYIISADSVAILYSKVAYNHPRFGGRYPRSVLEVTFAPGASQEEKQSALNVVGATVIGGRAGAYLIVVKDNGTAAPLWAAVDRLSALPQVVRAFPDIFITGVEPAFRRPEDGQGLRTAVGN